MKLHDPTVGTLISRKMAVRFGLEALLVATIGLFFVLWTPDLFYWQDEWTILQSASQQPLAGLHVNHMGHFFPLGRLAFLVQMWLFRSWYFPLLITNLFLAYLSVRLALRLVRRHFGKTPGALAASVLAVWFTSTGVVFDIQWGFQVAWFMSVTLGLLLADELLTHKHLRLRGVVFFSLAWLSLSSNLVPTMLLVSALYLSASRSTLKRRLTTISTLIGASVILTLLGSWIAFRFPPVDTTAIGVKPDLSVMTSNFWPILGWTLVMSIAWLSAPIMIFVPSGILKLEDVGAFLENQRLTTTVAAILLYLLVGFHAKRGNRFPLFLLIAMFGASLVVAAGRYGSFNSFFHERYAPVLGMIAALFWIGLLGDPKKEPRRGVRLAQSRYIISGLILLSTVVGVIRYPATLSNSSVQSRREQTNAQNYELSLCGTAHNVAIYGSIQIALSAADMCEIVASLDIKPNFNG